MALDYKQSAQLRTNITFQGRIASAALKWAGSILANSAVDLTQTVKRKEINYAEALVLNANAKAAELQPMVVQDPAVQGADLDPETGDSTIPDTQLQSAVEYTIQKIL